MKSTLVALLLAVSAFAQDQSAPVAAAACGPKDGKIDVKLDESQHTLSQPEAGKALVVFIQDIGVVNCLGGCLKTRIGLDGGWVGANQHNSYFSVSVEPGEHHVCASPQSRFGPATSEKICQRASGFRPFHGGSRKGLLLPHAIVRESESAGLRHGCGR